MSKVSVFLFSKKFLSSGSGVFQWYSAIASQFVVEFPASPYLSAGKPAGGFGVELIRGSPLTAFIIT